MLIAGFPAGSFQANCYVLAAEPGATCVVIDPGQDAILRLEPLLAEHKLRPAAVILTHGHLDHTATAAQFCRAVDVPAYIHPADEYMLDDPLAALSPELRAALAGMPMGELRPPTVLELSDLLEPGLAGLPLTIDHTPGHTGGSVVIRVHAESPIARRCCSPATRCSPDRSAEPTCRAGRHRRNSARFTSVC